MEEAWSWRRPANTGEKAGLGALVTEEGSRKIEMIVGSKKQVAQTAHNWNPKSQDNENEVKMVTPRARGRLKSPEKC